MQQLLPANFRELLAAISALIAISFAFISLNRTQRDHALRGTGLFLVAVIALFADNGWSYFAAVFIVATAVTQLEFLQNLAAILRGSKEYFDYQKEFLSQREVEANIAKDVQATEAAAAASPTEAAEATGTAAPTPTILPALPPGQFGLFVEEYTFKFLERKYCKPIERHVRFLGKSSAAEFDGVMRDAEFDRIFEIKTSRMAFFPHRIVVDTVRRLTMMLLDYQNITKRRAVLHLLLVGNFPPTFSRRIREYREAIMKEGIHIEFHIEALSFDDIGISVQSKDDEAA